MAGHDVSDEPRIPKGSGKGSGQWTTGSAASGEKPSKKSSASARNRIVTINQEDGTVEIRKGGSPAWRNNNPGNIIAGAWANEAGAIGSDGVFAIFPDEATGEEALHKHLNQPSYASLTIDEAVKSRTPPEDPRNDTPRTQKLVRDISRLPGNAVIGKLTPEEKQRLYYAIRRSEGWTPGFATRGVP